MRGGRINENVNSNVKNFQLHKVRVILAWIFKKKIAKNEVSIFLKNEVF